MKRIKISLNMLHNIGYSIRRKRVYNLDVIRENKWFTIVNLAQGFIDIK